MRVTNPDDDERYADIYDEYAWDQAQADMVDSLRDEALALEAHEKVTAAFAAMNLDFLEAKTRALVEKQVQQFVSQTISDDGSGKSEFSEEEWLEIQEQESLALDDRLEIDSIRKQAEFAEALAAIHEYSSEGDHWKAEQLQQEAEEALRQFHDRRRRRQNHEALQYEIVKALKERAWTREEFAERADISLSTVRNLMVSTDPDRRWRVQVQRAVEDALGWPRGTFLRLLETGEMEKPEPTSTQGPGLPVDARIRDELEAISLREGRPIGAILDDALRVYLKVYGPTA